MTTSRQRRILPDIFKKLPVIFQTVWLEDLFHWVFRKRFFLLSTNPEEAYRQGIKIKLWDILVLPELRACGDQLGSHRRGSARVFLSDCTRSGSHSFFRHHPPPAFSGVGIWRLYQCYRDCPVLLSGLSDRATVVCVFRGLLALLALAKSPAKTLLDYCRISRRRAPLWRGGDVNPQNPIVCEF